MTLDHPGVSPATRVVIRPFTVDDLDAVRSFYERLSAGSRIRRFWSPSWAGPAWELDHLARDPGSPAVVAWADGVVVGVARAQRACTTGDDAEVAVAVDDAWQHQGVGGRLGAALVGAARRGGVHHLSATVRPDNTASLRLFRRGFPDAAIRWESGQVVFDAWVA